MMKMQMQRWLVCFAALLAGQSALAQQNLAQQNLAQQNLAQQNPSHEFLKSGDYHVTQSWSQENSFERPYHVRVPDVEDKPRQLPVLFFLHGNGANAREAMRGLGYDLEEILAQEEEPGLGNGGLGRLADLEETSKLAP